MRLRYRGVLILHRYEPETYSQTQTFLANSFVHTNEELKMVICRSGNKAMNPVGGLISSVHAVSWNMSI